MLARDEHALIGLIYEAALDPSLWPLALETLANMMGARTGLIHALDQLNPAYNFTFQHNYPVALLNEYLEKGYDILEHEVNAPLLIANGIGNPSSPEDAHGSVEAYCKANGPLGDLMREYDLLAGTILLLDSGDFRWTVIGFGRSLSKGTFSNKAKAFLKEIGIHIRRALQIHWQISTLRNENNRFYTMLDVMETGVILLSTDKKIRYSNPTASSLLAHHGALRLQRGSLEATTPAENSQLQALIRGAIETSQRDFQGQAGGVIGLSGPNFQSPLMLSVAPLSKLGTWQDLRQDNISAAIFITDPEKGLQIAKELLEKNYGLSNRESDLCQRFVNTPSLEDIAISSGLSLETVRTYLKNIYEKTGKHSQAELIRFLTGLRTDFQHIT